MSTKILLIISVNSDVMITRYFVAQWSNMNSKNELGQCRWHRG